MVLDSAVPANEPFYSEFESVRLAAIGQEIYSCLAEYPQSSTIRLLDFGYLTGLVPRTLLSFFSLEYVLIDHPKAAVFADPIEREKLAASGIVLHPCALESMEQVEQLFGGLGKFDVILLGEIIEHLDPTAVANLISRLGPLLQRNGRLIITTPNLFGIANVARHLIGKDVQAVPLGHEIMIQGHIHLWSPSGLASLCDRIGLVQRHLFYYHGLEGTQYALSNKKWGSIGYQVWHKSLYLMAALVKRWRGFFVASYSLR